MADECAQAGASYRGKTRRSDVTDELTSSDKETIERRDERVGGVEDAVGVRVPEPEVQGDQVGVPEAEGGAALRAGPRAVRFARRRRERPVLVVAGGSEGAVARAGQRRLGRPAGEDPLRRHELGVPAAAHVDEDRRAAHVEPLHVRVEEVVAHVGHHRRDLELVAAGPGAAEIGGERGERDPRAGDLARQLARAAGRAAVVAGCVLVRPGHRDHDDAGDGDDRAQDDEEAHADERTPAHRPPTSGDPPRLQARRYRS